MINPMKLMELKGKIDQFQINHPKFPGFLRAVSERAVQEGTVVEFSVTTPDGEVLESNLKLKASDLEIIRSLKEFNL